ncbi:hypothetical protein [Methanimicrococcus blatticola]|uniref:Uncharacterized protein n=1 Tax=Methanimicrococcus blatticola TaxID=91560 RepID=A0A484F5G2_9EURY|nr:hypothetical protein [Methanimicrococcus blatticola]MBZ3936194.1 hypothetical protein [Methanimicrococcus blatticola]MCC2508437.1 hypothetical protein [Methanimicrococcus blatticola]TDQ70110.1 hypothetical protein C7391_0448 [Methanimicrococcus blatticola]
MQISSLLLILISFSLGGALILGTGAVLGNIQDLSLTSPVKIEIVDFSGGDRYNDSTRFQDNILILKHAGGSSVSSESVSIQIAGKGNAYLGIPGSGGKLVYGDVLVFYENISSGKKNSDFEKNNKEMLKDGFWSAGEKLILSGNDSLNASASSVFVSVDGAAGTSNNYGFSSNQTLEIRIYRKNKTGIPQLVLKKEAAV